MDTFVLHIRRLSGFTSAAASTTVMIDGSVVAKLRVGEHKDYTLSRKPVTIVLMTPVPMGKDIMKTVQIDPRDSREVTLQFTYKFNAKMFLPFGVFNKEQAFIETEIIYGPSVASVAPASPVYTPESAPKPTPAAPAYSSAPTPQVAPATPSADRKFCTECGSPNPRAAKFCIQCGRPFQS